MPKAALFSRQNVNHQMDSGSGTATLAFDCAVKAFIFLDSCEVERSSIKICVFLSAFNV